MKPKKFLGQNFLTNKNIAEKIVEAAEISDKDTILEVGPGKGILTEILAGKAKKIIAVEKDTELVRYLNNKFKNCKNLKIIDGDILKIKIPELKKYKIVANIPYYITSYFLRKFLESKQQPSSITLTLQKEVAERIVAKNEKESILSISVKSYGQPKIIAKVSAGNFFPKPKVDSAIITIKNISKDFFVKNKIREKNFFDLLRRGFGHKRKMLKNNLQSYFTRPGLVNVKCKIPALSRAEDLSLEQWKCLSASANTCYGIPNSRSRPRANSV